MSPRPWRICAEPGCPEPTQETRCPKHTRSNDRKYSRHREVYNSPRWRGLRRKVLRAEPWCRTPDCTNLATDVDHIVPIDDDPGLTWEESNLQPLCAKHHGQKTARETWHRKDPEKSSP